MTLAAYNARRKELTRLGRVGWLRYRLNTLGNIGDYLGKCREDAWFFLDSASTIAHRIRAYRRKHKFWECI